ncbi:Protein slit [Gryllus bimaculatus]|nr:Protein slit [Gryllus bimaculatus]
MDPWRGALLLLLAAAPARAGCPSECECRASGLHPAVDCSALQFTALPPGLPADTSHLRLGFNNIRVLRNGSLTTAPNVARLWLNDNGMEIIEPGAFNYLSSLSWLDLENNKITSLHPDTFVNLTHLFKMILSGNPLVVPENSVFLRSEYLQILDMANCGLEEIPSTAFTELRSLMTLRLGNNSLRAVTINVSSLSHLDLHKNSIGPTTNRLHISAPRLLKLDLSSCLFATISHDFLKLHLSDNKLQTISKSVFTSVPLLVSLYLDGNKISQIEVDAFEDLTQLTFLDLSRNSLQLPEDGPFLRSASLGALRLDACGLEALPAAALRALPALRSLSLAGNDLAFVSDAALRAAPALRALHVARNRWRCDCALRQLWFWCAGADEVRARVRWERRLQEPGAAWRSGIRLYSGRNGLKHLAMRTVAD